MTLSLQTKDSAGRPPQPGQIPGGRRVGVAATVFRHLDVWLPLCSSTWMCGCHCVPAPGRVAATVFLHLDVWLRLCSCTYLVAPHDGHLLLGQLPLPSQPPSQVYSLRERL